MPAADQAGDAGVSAAPLAGLAVSEDAFLDGRLRLCQLRSGYRAGLDAVLLAAAAPALADGTVLDAGAGAGAASLCYMARVPGPALTLLELQPPLAALAQRNIAGNGFSARARVITGDIRQPFPAVPRGGFDLVLTNPPWLEAARADPSPDALRHLAHVESAVPLPLWLERCLRLLKPRGWLALAHRADRLDAALAALAGRAGDIAVIPLWPRAGVAAARVILLARKGAKGPCRLGAGLTLHEADGRYTAAADAILRGRAALIPG